MKNRNPILVLVFSIITFGIYYLYWLSSTKKVLNKNTQKKVPTIWLMIIPFLFSIAAVVAVFIISFHNTSVTSSTLNPTTGYYSSTSTTTSTGTTVVILLIQAISRLTILPLTFYWTFKFSKSLDEYTNSELSTVLTF